MVPKIAIHTHPNVDPDIIIYCPRVLMMPLAPGPYLKMLTVPADQPLFSIMVPSRNRHPPSLPLPFSLLLRGATVRLTIDEPDYNADSWGEGRELGQNTDRKDTGMD